MLVVFWGLSVAHTYGCLPLRLPQVFAIVGLGLCRGAPGLVREPVVERRE